VGHLQVRLAEEQPGVDRGVARDELLDDADGLVVRTVQTEQDLQLRVRQAEARLEVLPQGVVGTRDRLDDRDAGLVVGALAGQRCGLGGDRWDGLARLSAVRRQEEAERGERDHVHGDADCQKRGEQDWLAVHVRERHDRDRLREPWRRVEGPRQELRGQRHWQQPVSVLRRRTMVRRRGLRSLVPATCWGGKPR